MRLQGLAPLVREAQSSWSAYGSEPGGAGGGVGVSGVLAEQLAREIGDGAEPGAVRVQDEPVGVAVVVRVIAGETTPEDTSVVAAADRAGVPVVLVQLWPQGDWTPPFVLSPFVVECRAGEGFPLAEIGARVAEAVGPSPALAARVPALRSAVESRSVRSTVARAALLGLRGRSRPFITLEQLRLASSLRTLDSRASGPVPTPVAAATVGALVASGFAFRAVARSARRVLPDPVANAAVAAAGTWALAEALRRLDGHLGA